MNPAQLKTHYRNLYIAIGILLSFLMVLPFLSNGQTLPYRVTNVTFSTADPTGTAASGAAWYNTTTKTVKVWQNNKYINATDSSIIKYVIGSKGQPGATGPSGPAGADGVCPSCPPSGGGSSLPGYVVYNPYVIETTSEIQVGGTNTTTTVAASGNTYLGITVASTDLVDYANLQYGLYLANLKKKILISANTFNTNKGLDIGKTTYQLTWEGGLTTLIKTVNNNTFSVIGRAQPTDNTDANLMIQATYNLRNIRIQAQSNQIGLEPGPTYTSVYEGIRVENALTAIHLRFNLNAYVLSCDAGTCTNGFIADMGNWPGATNSNSQSNHTTFYHCHIYSGNPNGGNVGFGVYASSGCVIDECIVEGGKYKKCVEYDFKMSTVVKDFTLRNTHFETVYGNSGGSTEAYVWLRAVNTVNIINSFIQYSGVFVNASGTPASLNVIISNIAWIVPPADGKPFYNAGGVQWTLWYNTDGLLSNPTTASSMFAGTATTKCGGYQCGNNKWEMYGFSVNSYNIASAAREAAAPEPIYQYELTLTINKSALKMMHPQLQAQVSQKPYTYQFETIQKAQEFASANPDFVATIMKL